jgi:hypothetical protein
MMFVVTPSLDSIEYKFNSKSIKFPKLHKVPTLEAININKPWSEWKERLRNFGVKPPKRGIELGWMTRGTRPKKPSSSRGFAREARGTRVTRGSRGSWGLKIENRTFQGDLVCTDGPMSARMKRRVRTDALMSALMSEQTRSCPRSCPSGRACVRANVLVSVRT